jgi:hypothetical protein
VPEFHRGPLCQNGMAAQASWYWGDSNPSGKLEADDHWQTHNEQTTDRRK